MRKAVSAPSRAPLGARSGLGVTIASAIVAYGLLVLTSAMTVERLVEALPPDIIAATSVTGGFAP